MRTARPEFPDERFEDMNRAEAEALVEPDRGALADVTVSEASKAPSVASEQSVRRISS